MEDSVAVVTVNVTVALADPRVAVMFVVPVTVRGCPMAIPLLGPILATVVSEDVQVTCRVRFRVLPLLNVPVAVNWMVVP